MKNIFIISILTIFFADAHARLKQHVDAQLKEGVLQAKSNIGNELKGLEIFQYKGINEEEHNIEVYYPDTLIYSGDRPCVVFFHGGGWRGGDLAQFRGMCNYFASRGMVAITANYSMHTAESEALLNEEESRKTICVTDGKTVIRWIKNKAGSLGIDSSKIVAGGASAGGHIAVLSMLDEEHNNPSDSLEIKTNVQAFVLFCPAFTLLDKDKTPEVNVFKLLKKSLPPSLFIVGETDNWEKASNVLAEDLADKGNDVRYWMGEKQGHMFYRNGNWMDVSLKKTDEFLVSLGFLEGQSPLNNPDTGETLVEIEFVKTGNRNRENMNFNEFQINPNPVRDFIYVQSIKDKSNYRIVNLEGKTVQRGLINEKQLNVHRLKKGIYVMNIEGYACKKFYKE